MNSNPLYARCDVCGEWYRADRLHNCFMKKADGKEILDIAIKNINAEMPLACDVDSSIDIGFAKGLKRAIDVLEGMK